MKATLAALLAFSFTAAANAGDGHAMGHAMDHGAAAHPMAMSAPAESVGTVTRVDDKGGRVTIKHGPLQNLGMPAMTMAFKVASAGMLSAVRPGDAVRFVAEKVDGNLTVTRIRKSK